MADNGKKEYAVGGLELDCVSAWGRKYLCYVVNNRGIKKYVKRKMNKRFRRRWKIENRKDNDIQA